MRAVAIVTVTTAFKPCFRNGMVCRVAVLGGLPHAGLVQTALGCCSAGVTGVC